ncbi:putative thioredoxin [Aureimonas phyllosphaerae]|uniref:Thioredoxin n=2 Tax=Aureimonas phyllosphaerae TaxID=1166078 RepID=A0A7W6FUI1_9HYPH|nr:thioredoxin [Aureimonas phyllosphaerae]MBB3936093.1 putative thioredoxin [Aureimonas phyllosphaerae]MBB3960182.1 putative thioredoxin [Aureimonas phyllosphaerae]
MSNNPYASQLGGYGAQTTAAGLGGTGRSAAPAPASELVKDTTTAAFSADVVRESRNQPVLVDFWAPWCGPCKQLTPVLERAVQAAGGRVKLVKMNIDEHPSIAGQLGVQSIPAVFAFVDGQPVDGFMGALPESEVKAFIDRLTAGRAAPGGDPLAEALEQAAGFLAAGNAAQASQLFGAVLQHDPENAKAAAGLAECYLAAGDTARAQSLADAMPPSVLDDPAFATVRARLKLQEEIAGLGDASALEARLAANPDDHQARYDLALIAQAKGDRAGAADQLLEIVKRDRTFEDDGARRKLLEFFEAWGPMDPATKDGRRKLSSLLFR